MIAHPIISHGSDKTIIIASEIKNTLSIDSFKSSKSNFHGSFQLTKYTEEGEVMWIKPFSSINGCSMLDMKVHPDGTIFMVLVGKDFEFEFGPQIMGVNVILVRLNRNGEYLSHSLLNNYNMFYLPSYQARNMKDFILIDKKGTCFFRNFYCISDTFSKSPTKINVYSGIKIFSFDTNYNFNEILHIKLNTEKKYGCHNSGLDKDRNQISYPDMYLNDNGTMMLNYYYYNYTIVNGDTSFTKYRNVGRFKLESWVTCDSNMLTLIGYGYQMINFDAQGKILNKANISISKNDHASDTIHYINSAKKKVIGIKESVSQRIPANNKFMSIGNKYYLAIALQSFASVAGNEYHFDSLSTALFEFDSAFNFIKVKDFKKSLTNMLAGLVQDTKDNPVVAFGHIQNTSIDGFVYKTTNGYGMLLATLDKTTFKTINITSLNENNGNVSSNAFSNDAINNIYSFGNFNGVMEINKQQIIDSNNTDYFFLKLGLCNVPPKLNKTGSLNLCIGANDTIKAQKFYDRYRWFYNETEQRSITSYKMPVTKPGRYYLVVDSGECRGISDVVTYTQTVKLDVGKDTLICNQDSFLLQTTPDKKSYLWNTGSKSSYIYPRKTGKYFVSIIDKFDCKTADTINVKFIHMSKPKLSTSRIPDICEGQSVDIFTTANFEKYRWLQNNLLLPKDTSSIVKVKTAGNYIVEADSAGCSRRSDPVAVNVYPNPEIDLGDDKILCNTKIFELEAPPGYVSYLWSTSETTSKINVKNSGKYSVSVFSQFGCKGADEVIITMDSLTGPLLYLTNGTLYCLSPGTFIWYLNGIEMNGLTSNSIIPKESGEYKVIVTNTATGCQNSAKINYIYKPKDDKFILAVYPNPAGDKLNLLFDLGENIHGTINYKMYQIDGKLLGKGDFLFDSNITNTISLPTEFLAQGMYYLEVNINEFKNVIRFKKL